MTTTSLRKTGFRNHTNKRTLIATLLAFGFVKEEEAGFNNFTKTVRIGEENVLITVLENDMNLGQWGISFDEDEIVDIDSMEQFLSVILNMSYKKYSELF